MQIGKGKQGVKIGEYVGNGVGDALRLLDKNATIGWIEPACDNPQWIAWFTKQGDAILYTSRGSTGAVQGEPITVRARGRVGPPTSFSVKKITEMFDNLGPKKFIDAMRSIERDGARVHVEG